MNKDTIENCHRTLFTLKDFLHIAGDQNNDFARAAVIQAFEFTYEVYWKTFQKLAREQGAIAAGPKPAIAYAFQAGILSDQSMWLDIINDRNMTTHTYHEEISKQIYGRIKNDYLKAFEQAYDSLLNLKK